MARKLTDTDIEARVRDRLEDGLEHNMTVIYRSAKRGANDFAQMARDALDRMHQSGEVEYRYDRQGKRGRPLKLWRLKGPVDPESDWS